MPQRAKKAKPKPAEDLPEKAAKALPPPEPGLPAPDSVVGEEPFTSPSGARYRIFHTDETDAYEEPAPPKRRRRRAAKSSSPSGDARQEEQGKAGG